MPARAPEADTQDHHRERRGRVESGHPSTGANVTSTGRLMLAVRGGRDLARNRTAEGRNRAKLEGKHMGRPLPSHRHSRNRPPDGPRKALRCRSWLTVMTAALPPLRRATQA